MSDFSTAFAEVKRAVQPDETPKLTYGDGQTPNEEMELDQIILANVRAKVWASGLQVGYGDIIVPTVGNGQKYRVATPGTLGATEPTSWPGEFGSVTSGDVTLVEDGAFTGNTYDIRRAKYEALDLKVKRSASENQYLNDARGQASSFQYLNWARERDKYKAVGVA